jgi:hypothetical protein
MKNVSMGDNLPGIIGKVERRQGGVTFQTLYLLFVRLPIGTQACLLANFSGISSAANGHSTCALVRGSRRTVRGT